MSNYRKWYKWIFAIGLALVLSSALISQVAFARTSADDPVPGSAEEIEMVDHSKFPSLKGPFESPQEVTRACLACHTDAAEEIMHTTHWTWEYVNETTGQTLGKKTLINNFCIDINSNEPRCTSCHTGYGWKDDTFDFTVQENVDCLVCHDTTGDYKKFPAGAGLPVSEPTEFPAGSGNIWTPPDLANVAQNIGLTSRDTCGSCHFYGGGGDEVKHGDLDSSLVDPSFELDVHMSTDGQNFTCTTCHMTSDHAIIGSRYSMDPEAWKGCESCHGDAPHELSSLNQHTDKLACQTCHIPEYARGGIGTKMTWDWSKAGELLDGKPVIRKDENGHVIYDGQKGEFTIEENVVPEYVWFNGTVTYTLAGDKIDPTTTVKINEFQGDINDPNAKIWPVKRFEAVSPFDSGNNILAIPHLFGKDDSAYWGNYDWGKAITFGMDYAGLPYSGEYDFVKTEMYWPITHMVAPASDALKCKDCHTDEAGRIDFVALGYSVADVARLTNFPPSITIGELTTPEYSPETCVNCHTDEHSEWMASTHGTMGVGCVSCHVLDGVGEHPTVPFTIEKEAETCGSCHLAEYGDYTNSKHGEIGIACSSCHNPHTQEVRIAEGNQTSCEACHKDKKTEVQHSTHLAAGLTCNDCHLNTDLNSGHTFGVMSDSCIKCHGDTIHSTGIIAQANLLGAEQSADVEEVVPVATPVVEAEQPTKVGIVFSYWVILLGGIFAGAMIHWFSSTRRLDITKEDDEK